MPKPAASFYDVLTEAVADLAENGFDSMERIERWTRELRAAAERSMMSPESVDQQLRNALAAIYQRLVDRGEIAKYHPGVERYTIEKIRPKLRAELDRRIMASANLIRLNRAQAIDKTLQRFQGWSTSIPPNGVPAETRAETKKAVRKSLAQLPFEERRVFIDQGHKLVSAINEIVASDGGAIAGTWHSHWREAGYNYREDHKERDLKVYLVRGSWAQQAGLVKKGGVGYYDEVTAVGQEPFCFPGDSRIPFADGVEKAYRRWYSGDLTTIITASGKTLRATPNHPILTSKGWIAIGALNEGDDVIETTEQSLNVLKKYNDNAIPVIADIFGALQEFGGSQSTRNGQLHQFHGDGTDSDVDIVDAARPLSFGRKPICGKHIKQFNFSMSLIGTASICAFKLFIHRSFSVSSRFVSGFYQAMSAALAFTLHANKICFATGTDNAPAFSQPSHNCHSSNVKCSRQRKGTLTTVIAAIKVFFVEINLWRTARYSGTEINQSLPMSVPNQHRRNIENGGDFLKRLPFRAQAVNVIKVERKHFAGHVYNLQTVSGWYVTESIITHNCRCYMTWLYNLRDLPADMLTAKGKASLSEARAMLRANAGGRADAATSTKMVDVSRSDAEAFDHARALDVLGYLDGLAQVRATPDLDEWNAYYDSDPDEIVLRAKFSLKDRDDKVRTLLHEAGHRGQDVDPDTYREFKRLHLNRVSSFLSIANQTHLRAFERTGQVDSVAAEVFAESYARAMLGTFMPAELEEFWRARLDRGAPALTAQAEADYIAFWPNKITRCQRCTMFVRVRAEVADNRCSAVSGPISAHGHCRLFEIGQPVTAARPAVGAEAMRVKLERIRTELAAQQ